MPEGAAGRIEKIHNDFVEAYASVIRYYGGAFTDHKPSNIAVLSIYQRIFQKLDSYARENSSTGRAQLTKAWFGLHWKTSVEEVFRDYFLMERAVPTANPYNQKSPIVISSSSAASTTPTVVETPGQPTEPGDEDMVYVQFKDNKTGAFRFKLVKKKNLEKKKGNDDKKGKGKYGKDKWDNGKGAPAVRPENPNAEYLKKLAEFKKQHGMNNLCCPTYFKAGIAALKWPVWPQGKNANAWSWSQCECAMGKSSGKGGKLETRFIATHCRDAVPPTREIGQALVTLTSGFPEILRFDPKGMSWYDPSGKRK